VIEPLTDSEQRNLNTVDGVHPFWNRGDIEGVLAYYDDDITWNNVALEEVYEGKAAVGQFLTRLFTAIPDLKFSVSYRIVRGDNVAVQWMIRGTHLGTFMGIPPTGRTLEIVGVSMLTLRDGKFLRDDFYFDIGAVMRQMGLMPSLTVTQGTAGRSFLWLAVTSLNALTRGGRRARGARQARRSAKFDTAVS
jgi:steroid delta-isomerase-like uncharacterized protein